MLISFVSKVTMPLITPHWELQLNAGEESPCLYDWTTYRYCAQLKTQIKSSSAPTKMLKPTLRFSVSGNCQHAASPAASLINASAGGAAASSVGVNIYAFVGCL